MNPNEYQRLAVRTECDQEKSMERMCPGEVGEDTTTDPIRLNHAVLGLAGEVGELASAVEKWIYYGQGLDATNVLEEIGDCLWYLAQACNVLEADMGDVMQSNIDKLRKRYPDKYTNEHAAEKNRDRVAEREVLDELNRKVEPQPIDPPIDGGYTGEVLGKTYSPPVKRGGELDDTKVIYRPSEDPDWNLCGRVNHPRGCDCSEPPRGPFGFSDIGVSYVEVGRDCNSVYNQNGHGWAEIDEVE